MAVVAYDTIVVGGGVAGLSVLARLARHGRTLLLEREPTLAAHASGRNAAIYRPLENDRTSAALARQSHALIEGAAEHPILKRVGLTLVGADPAALEGQRALAVHQRVPARMLTGDALVAMHRVLAGGEIGAGLLLPEGGVLDIHELLSTLERSARRAGARIVTGTGVQRLVCERGRLVGVELVDGHRIAAGQVVIAAGAWARALGAQVGAALPLQPYRRHLVQLEVPEGVAGPSHDEPVVWRMDEEVYVRREGRGLLASPCDTQAWAPENPPADAHALERLADRLQRCMPQLTGAGVRAHWACLRTFAPDHGLVLGPDPRVSGLHWMAGLGGKGMSVAPAAGELVARRVLHDREAIDPDLAPERLLG